ncbi:MAG: WD40/YVTN/BNR-like repeat-containing protein, partial [Bryobacteraceae bacterium]
MIDDSDVMSIAVDRADPRRIYASACSGIYLSENGAAMLRKIQGIPYSARRTQSIVQDPQAAQTVYAATTEGLWQTRNAGASWRRITAADWVINSVVIVPRGAGEEQRIVIGTERLGVLTSDDGGAHFQASNLGFYHRQIVALALDKDRPGRILAVLANAPDAIVATENGGKTWTALGRGLKTKGLRRIYASPDGWWAAREQGGLVRYDAEKVAWIPAGGLSKDSAQLISAAVAGEKKKVRSAPARRSRREPAPTAFAEEVADMAFSQGAWYAATQHGLLCSTDNGNTWSLLPLGPLPTLPVRSVRVSQDGQELWVVSLRGLVFSHDAGKTWSWHDLPLEAGGALWLDAATETQPQTIVAGAENGLYISR